MQYIDNILHLETFLGVGFKYMFIRSQGLALGCLLSRRNLDIGLPIYWPRDDAEKEKV